MSLRTERIATQLLEEIARVLRDEVTDHRIKMVTVLRVDLAPDLSHALVAWSLFDTDGEPDFDEIDEVEDGLESASGYIRRKIAAALNLRKTPALRFHYDPSLRLAGETMEILDELRTREGAEETDQQEVSTDVEETKP